MMWSSQVRSWFFTRASLGLALLLGVGLFNVSAAVHTQWMQVTEKQPSQNTPFANVMTQLAAPTATKGTPPAATAVSPSATAPAPALNAADALATITSQQAQIKALQTQLDAAQGDQGATLYAVVIIVIGLLLASAVFFGLRRS